MISTEFFEIANDCSLILFLFSDYIYVQCACNLYSVANCFLDSLVSLVLDNCFSYCLIPNVERYPSLSKRTILSFVTPVMLSKVAELMKLSPKTAVTARVVEHWSVTK